MKQIIQRHFGAVLFSAIYLYYYLVLFLPGKSVLVPNLHYSPSVKTQLVYLIGLLMFIIGYRLTVKYFKVEEGPSFNYDTLYKIVLGVYILAVGINLAELVRIGDIPLLNIASRWSESPKMVLLASTQILLVPAISVIGKMTDRNKIGWIAFAVSIVSLSLLGARHLPLKLIISFFLTIFYLRVIPLKKLLAIMAITGMIAFIGLGGFTKGKIYGGNKLTWGITLMYSDSAGAMQNLEKITDNVSPSGMFHGRLLVDTTSNIIPGVKKDYANYQLGSLLGARKQVQIGNVRINRSVSLTTTILGAPYADFGWFGVIAQMLFLGGIMGLWLRLSEISPAFIPVFAILSSFIIAGVNLGVYNEHFIIWAMFSLLVIVAVKIKKAHFSS